MGVRVSPPEALVPAVPTEAQSRVHGFPQEREAVPLALTFYSLLPLLHGLCVTVKVAVSRFKYVKETFSASLVSVYLSLLKITVR